MLTAVLTDDEINAICDGLRQSAAMVRYLRKLGVPVQRKPNGRPLVRRADWDARQQEQNRGSNGPRWSRSTA